MADWGNPPLGSVAIQSGFGSGVEVIFSGPPSRDRYRVLAKAMRYHLQGQVLIHRDKTAVSNWEGKRDALPLDQVCPQ